MSPPTNNTDEPNIVLCGNRNGHLNTELRTERHIRGLHKKLKRWASRTIISFYYSVVIILYATIRIMLWCIFLWYLLWTSYFVFYRRISMWLCFFNYTVNVHYVLKDYLHIPNMILKLYCPEYNWNTAGHQSNNQCKSIPFYVFFY